LPTIILFLTGEKASRPGMSGGTGVTSAHWRNNASLHGPHVGGLGKSSILHTEQARYVVRPTAQKPNHTKIKCFFYRTTVRPQLNTDTR